MSSLRGRKQYIDLIRAFAVCLVFMYHFSGYIKQYNTQFPLCYEFTNGNWGNVGVFLFFMISGNCLFSKYESKFEFKEFLFNRLSKILVPFWICYAAFFLINFWNSRTFPEIPIYKFSLTIIGMDGFFSYRTPTFYILGEWFLGSIIFVYLLFPVIRICIKKNIHITIFLLFILNGILYYNNFWGFFKIDIGRNLIVSLFYFVLGIWVERIIKRVTNNRAKIGMLCLICIIAILILIIKLPISKYLGGMIISTTIYLLFMQLEKIMTIAFISNIILWISKNSYIIFLTHHVIMQKVSSHFEGYNYSFKGVFCIFLICILFMNTAIFIFNKLTREIKNEKVTF